MKKCRKIAVDRDTTLTGLIRTHLQTLAETEISTEEANRRRKALQESFDELSFNSRGKKWTREELNERPTKYLKARQ
ncbi:MAG: hypothetical protein WDO18_02715 [Acidobacteriota bacterium]